MLNLKAMPNDIFLSKEAMASRFAAAINSQEPASYSFLLGAGFSRSAGIPLARTIAAVLSHYKISKYTSPSEPLGEIIRRVLQEDEARSDSLSNLAALDPSFFGLDYSEVYTRLFDDGQLFPNGLRSQARFVAELLGAAEQMALGWNFESLYLGFLCAQLQKNSAFKINTILTTNFDNVLVNSFSHIDGHFRVLDHPQAIIDDPFDTPYPRLLYLHGRYLHYRVVNSSSQIERLREQLRDDRSLARNPRLGAINKSLKHASEGGGLIVIGYDGWEDAVMAILERELGRENGFEAGITWCHYGDGPIRPAALQLAKDTGRINIVKNISALEVMQCLLGAAGFSESEVVQRLQRKGATEYADLRRRWVEVQEKRHEIIPASMEKQAAVVSGVSFVEVEKVCDRAMRDSRFSALAFELLREYLSSMGDMPPQIFARVLRLRAELRILYSGKPALAIADFYAVWGLETNEEASVFLGLAEAYRQLGQYDKAGICRSRAYLAAEKSGDPLSLAKCRFLDAQIRFELQTDIYNAERLCSQAEATFEQLKKLDLRSKCFSLRASMCGFNNQGNEGLGYAQRALDDAKESDHRIMECRARLLEGYCYSTLGDFEKAARAFEAARDIAVEGPQYRILANIDVHLADVKFAQSKIQEAGDLLAEAIEYFSFVADAIKHEQAILTGLLNALLTVSVGKLDEVTPLFDRVAAFERFEDEAESTGQWLAVVSSLLRLENRSEFKEFVIRAVHRGNAMARTFEEKARKIEEEMMKRNATQAEHDRHSRLVAHVRQQALTAEMLCRILNEEADQEPTTESIVGYYHALVGIYRQFGFASRIVEVLTSIIGYELMRSGRIPADKVLSYKQNAGPEQFSKVEVQDFCRNRGSWPLVDLIQ
jgi:tetratricopeptide (TPR) repeat protein